MLKTFLQENQIIVPSYQLYGGLSGYQDYGIVGFQIKKKLIESWRNLFLRNCEIHEIELPAIMPHAALKASGHVDRFTDFVVYDAFGQCHRADHFAKKWFHDNKMDDLANQVDSFDQATLELKMNAFLMMNAANAKKWFMEHDMIYMANLVESWDRDMLKINCAKHEIPDYSIKVLKKNLMIEVPSNSLVRDAEPDFLRPELAQGIFVNFKACYSFLQNDNRDFKPFGIAQVGQSYRKEISPQPLIRMREFTQAELEYFVDPNKKTHVDIDQYLDLVVPLLTSDMQLNGTTTCLSITIRDALQQNIISNELMAYFIAKISTGRPR